MVKALSARRESDLQKDVLKYLKEHGIFHIRTQMGMQSGLPDIILCYRGFFIGLELKREDGKGRATEQQKKVIESVRNSGGTGILLSSLEHLKLILEQADKLKVVNVEEPIDWDWL